MPILTLQCAQDGPTIQVIVGVSKPRYDALTLAGIKIPPPQVARFLIDTGASGTLIDPSILQPLGIPVSGTGSMMTPSTGGTPHPCNLFDVSLLVPHGQNSYHMLTPCVPAIESVLSHQGIDGLLGRDVLQSCLFRYNGTSSFYILAIE